MCTSTLRVWVSPFNRNFDTLNIWIWNLRSGIWFQLLLEPTLVGKFNSLWFVKLFFSATFILFYFFIFIALLFSFSNFIIQNLKCIIFTSKSYWLTNFLLSTIFSHFGASVFIILSAFHWLSTKLFLNIWNSLYLVLFVGLVWKMEKKVLSVCYVCPFEQ